MTVPPRVLLIGGLDPSGGAGVTLDATVVSTLGATPLPVAVVLTVQSRRGFAAAHPVPIAQWRAAVAAVVADGGIDAVKIGLLAGGEAIAAVAEALRGLPATVPIVVDPVLSASAGGLEVGDDVPTLLRECLLPLATLITPNLPEAARLFGGDLAAALAVVPAVLCKGGHADGGTAVDELTTRTGRHRFERPRRDIGVVRGTGCALASAIATRLAQGADVVVACRTAGDWLAERLARLGPPPPDGLPRTIPFAS